MQEAELAKQQESKRDKDEEEEDENNIGEKKDASPVPIEIKVVDDHPIEVHIDGESDDEFEYIEIKEKIKAFIEKNGMSTRIPDELINEAVRWRLNRNDCQNRGYVLDGYPKSFE